MNVNWSEMNSKFYFFYVVERQFTCKAFTIICPRAAILNNYDFWCDKLKNDAIAHVRYIKILT